MTRDDVRGDQARRFLFGRTDDLFTGAAQPWMSELMRRRNATQSLLLVTGGICAVHMWPSCGIVSRSRALLSGNSPIEPEVIKMFEQLQRISVVKACCIVFCSQDSGQTRATKKLVEDTVRLSKSLVTMDLENPCELLYGTCTIAFCTVVGDSWFVAVTAEALKLKDLIRPAGAEAA
ncbi:Hypothetical protein, putative [Bodo saltans]|uniref:Uncharacterized protein n=1 Tax=Bodo saltans TaxID=75058 RepID=A0A0S4IX52_BODSA|nr:Hypothetical protein, putative [Bodo saltans]|eukprot:CUG35306.1 Hypothetical protein, putative [Bodo saltans]